EGVARLGDLPVELKLGPSSDDEALADPDFVFVIPGIRPRSPTILRALEQSVPVLTEMALFFRLCPATIVGITGTKGKTTTTTLIARVLALGPRPVLVGGNIGHAVIQEVDRLTRNDIVVLELSSFQLETLGHSPHVAVVTNVLEDHLDFHGTRDAYVAAKANIVAWQGPRDIAVLNLDDPTTVALHTGAASEVRGYSLTLRPKRGAYRAQGGAPARGAGAPRPPRGRHPWRRFEERRLHRARPSGRSRCPRRRPHRPGGRRDRRRARTRRRGTQAVARGACGDAARGGASRDGPREAGRRGAA